jgi:hypothetical protein
MVTREEYDAPNSSRKKKKEEVQELSNASKETTPDSTEGGGGDEVDKEEDEGEESKQEIMFDRIEAELKWVQQALYSSHAVSTILLSVGDIEVGNEPAQLHKLADSTKAHLHWVQEEKD